MNDGLGDIMKSYENVWRQKLIPRMPAIIRLDGKAFHSFTKGMQKPYDYNLRLSMDIAAKTILDEVSTARFAYSQSDEINILLIDYNKFNTQQYVDGNIQKITSICASIAGASLTLSYGRCAYFDARVFSLPESEISNYFIWRQQDATRNAIQSAARSFFSHKECLNKSCDELQEMMWQEKSVNFDTYPIWFKRGRIVRKKERPIVDDQIPIFTKDRSYLLQYMEIEES